MAIFPHWDWIGQDYIAQDLKGAQGQRIAIAASRDARGTIGSLEIVYIGMHNDLHHIRQIEGGNSASWTEMKNTFLGSGGGAAKAQEIAIGQNALGDSRLVLFYIGDNFRLYRNTQQTAGSLAWGGETPFAKNEATSLAVALGPERKLELVYGGKEGHLYHNRQSAAGSDEWVGETPFPGLSALQVAIAANPNNQDLLEIFYIGTNHKLYHIHQRSTAMTDWTDGKDILDNDLVAQLSVGTNADGRLEVFYVGPNAELRHVWQTSTVDTTLWSPPTRFPGNKANYVTAISNKDGRLEIFYMGNDQGLFHNWQAEPSGNWVGETRVIGDSGLRVAGTLNDDGRMEICYLGIGNHLYHNSQLQANSAWINTNAIGGVTPFPGGTLASNTNYVMSNQGFLTDIAATIVVSQDILVDKSAPENTTNFDATLKGYSFQLNCYSPLGQIESWQQYVMLVSKDGKDMLGFINNWKGTDTANAVPLTKENASIKLCSLPGKVPAGYQLQIILLNDENGIITAVNFRVVDDSGNEAANSTMTIDHYWIDKATSAPAPIVALTMNIVGEVGGLNAHFISGAGQIIYAASTTMTAGSILPTFTEFRDPTGEKSNSTYGPISPQASNLLTQTFGVS